MENLPVIYGEKKGGGHTPVEAADTLSSKQTMRLLFALSEGQIDSVEDILVNSASISNYSSTVDYEVRQGTVDQTVIKGFSEVEAPLTGGGVFPVELKAGVQHIYSLLGMYDAARVNLTIPRLMQVTGEGDRVGYTVTLSVYKRHQPFGGSPGSWQLASTITKNGKCTNPYSWDVRLEKPATTGELDSWGIMIVRDSADDSDDKHYSTTALSAITTIVESSLTYPHTALVGVTLKDAAQFGGSIPEIKFKVKGIKLPLPVNYNPTTRTYTGVWNGAFKSVREYTDNLAWITYWVLREHGSTFLDSEWGLEIAASDIDVGSFYLYAQYCDQLVSDGKGGQEPRYTAHFQFIERDNVPTFLTYLLNLGNANFSSNSLGQISIIWDGAGQSITKVVSNATVVDGVFEYSSNDLEGRTNLVNVTYAREELFGDSDTATHYEQTLIDRYGLQTSDVVLFGCKSEAQALRKARAVLYNNCYATDLVTFRQLFQGATYQIGELVSVMDSDNVVTNPKHGIIIESSLLAGTTTLALDRSIVLTNASYTIQFIGNDGTTFLSKAITQTNGSFSSVTYTGSEVPFVGGTVLFSTTALTPRTVKVIKVDKDDEHVYTVTGLTHNESKYSYIETVGSIATPSGSFINFNNFTVPAVSNITVDEVFSSNGVVEFSKLAVDWDWNVSGTEDYRATFDISYRRDNQEYQQARNLGTSDFDIEYPLPGVYDIYIWAVNPFSGLRSVVTSIVYNFRTATAVSTLLPPTNVVVPNTAGVVFQQRDLPLTWTFPVANDTKVDKLKDYVVQVLDYATSTVKGTYTVTPNTAKGGDFLLTFAENAAIFGTAQRQFRVRVFSRDLVGDLSNYVEVVPNNPAPTVSTFAVSAVLGAAYVKATIPSDPDLVSYTFKKYSAATGGTLLGTITTVSNYVDFEATAGTEYYYTVTPNDSFGTGTESTRTASTALSAEIDTYTYTGLQFTPNSPANNYVAWSSFVGIKNGTTSVTVAAGNAQWTAGTLYLYYIPGNTTLQSSTSSATAIAAGGRILATYKGGTNLTCDAGRAFIDGDQIIAGSLLTNALATNTAYITNMAQIGNIIQSDNYSNSGGSYTGWRIDKDGAANFNSITIKDSAGNVTMASGGAVWDYISNPSGTKPANNATVGATWGTNISGQPSNDLILNNLQTGAWVVGQTPPWVLNGTSAENAIDYDTDVNGVKVPVWKCIANADGNESGGWYKNEGDPSFGKNWFKVDKNKPYRFAVPVKITGGNTGSYFWGIGENTVCDLNTSNKNNNPYFVYGGRSGLVANRWYLLVGYVFPAGSTGNTNAGSGIFDLTTGELVAERWNYCWASDVEYTGTRAYQFYCANAGETQVFGYPTVEIVDGTESKLFNNLGYAALLNAQQKWSDVGGIGKPADNATVGANSSNLAIGTSTNVIKNSDFYNASLSGWSVISGYLLTGITTGVDLGGWYPVGGHAGWIHEDNANNPTGYVDFGTENISVIAGNSYEYQCKTGAHRCKVDVFVYWFNSAGSVVGNTTLLSNNDEASGGTTLAGYKFHYGFGVAPANAVYVRFVIRKNGTFTGQADSWAFFTQAYFGTALANQTEASVWSAGGSAGAFANLNLITSNNTTTYIDSANGKVLNNLQQWAEVNGATKPEDNATKSRVFQQATAPTSGMTLNDLWVDTTTLNPAVYRWSGASWMLAGDITANNTAAGIAGQGALATANSANWSSQVTGTGKPADYADVTNYNDTRVSNVIEENGTLFVARPIGASYDNAYPAVTGMIRIILPQGFTNTMMKLAVNVYTYSSDKSFSLNLAGYNYQPNSTWYSTEANLIGSTAADNRVRFGYDSTLGKCCIYIGEPTSSWSYPKVMVKDFIAGYSNFARSVWETGWAIDIVTSAPQNVTQDYADALIDAASFKNQGAFATLNKITSGNATTFIDNAAIGSAQIANAAISNAQIDRASVNKLQVVTADIVDANVSTLKIAGNAVTIPVFSKLSSLTAKSAGSWQTVLSVVVPASATDVRNFQIMISCSCYTEAEGYEYDYDPGLWDVNWRIIDDLGNVITDLLTGTVVYPLYTYTPPWGSNPPTIPGPNTLGAEVYYKSYSIGSQRTFSLQINGQYGSFGYQNMVTDASLAVVDYKR
jgi:predicted phage tail protein